MTDKQLEKVRRNAYKYYDEVIYNRQDWSKRDIALSSFQAGADYALKNKYDELKDAQGKKDPNIVQFLKDNGVYELFFANLFRHKQRDNLGQYLLYFFFTIEAISAAFLWNETPEGHDFWEELSEAWAKQF